jgi:hypothetical protein
MRVHQHSIVLLIVVASLFETAESKTPNPYRILGIRN